MFSLIYSVFGYPLGFIMWVCYKVIPIYGIALLLFTVIVRACLVPLSIKQQKSMVKMQIFRPRMEEIQKKYANNKEKMNEEMMKLYQEEGYNPMMGCLPMLIQMPILLGLYDVIQKPMTHLLHISAEAIEAAKLVAAPILGKDPTAFVKDYSAQLQVINAFNQNPDAFSGIATFSEKMEGFHLSVFGLDLTQTPMNHGLLSVFIIIPLLSLVTSLFMTLFTMKQSQSTAGDNPAMAGMSKGMMLVMPLMSGYLAYILPAGLGLYWTISNVLMAVQTFLLNKYMNPAKLAAKAQEEYAAKKEQERKEKIEAKKKLKTTGEADVDKALSQKEINRLKLAAARKRDAEKYGEEYIEVTDDDLK